MRRWLAILVFLAFVVVVSSALARSDASTRFTVTSSLDGKSALPLRIHWIAHLHHLSPSRVLEVDYFIDGKKAWVEKSAPYYYGGYSAHFETDAPWRGGNWLVTSSLTPGTHTFTVRVLRLTGAPLTDTVKASVVPAPAPPANLAGAWTRIVTADDLKKGHPGPPPGRWTFHVTSVGWGGDGSSTSIPETSPGWAGLDRWDVRYVANGDVVMGPEVVTPDSHGPNFQVTGFCGIDQPHTWTVVLSSDDQRMRLDPVDTDNCGVRVALLQGTWTRVH